MLFLLLEAERFAVPYRQCNKFTLQACAQTNSPGIFAVGARDPAAAAARAEGCPTAKDEIATDRPDVTNSSLVVPVGSLQSENGVNFTAREGGRTIDGTNARW